MKLIALFIMLYAIPAPASHVGPGRGPVDWTDRGIYHKEAETFCSRLSMERIQIFAKMSDSGFQTYFLESTLPKKILISEWAAAKLFKYESPDPYLAELSAYLKLDGARDSCRAVYYWCLVSPNMCGVADLPVDILEKKK